MKSSEKLQLGFAVKVKHGDLLKALKDRGWTQADGARYFGVTPVEFGCWCNLKRIPSKASMIKLGTKFVELTGQLPEELFPQWIESDKFQETPREFEMYQELTPAALEYAQQGLLPAPEEIVERHEQISQIHQHLASLPTHQRVIVKDRLAGMSITEIAEKQGVSRQRVQQVYPEALAKVQLAVLGVKTGRNTGWTAKRLRKHGQMLAATIEDSLES